MLLKTTVKLLRANWKHALTTLVLIPVPVFVLTFLGSHLFSQRVLSSEAAAKLKDPTVDFALLVEPNTTYGQVAVNKSGGQAENLMNWNFTPTTCTGS